MDFLLIMFLYAFLGGAIKFIDQAYDERSFSIRSANIVAVIAGVTMGYLMAADSPFSTAFFSAMLISLVLARKIDNRAFALGSALAVISLLAFYPTHNVIWELGPIFLFLLAGFVDEIADGLVHRRGIEGPLQMFLNYRPFSDLALLAMVIMGQFSWLYLLPYFCFTLSYMIVERVTVRELSLADGVDWFKHRVLRRSTR
jgi:hypothetical protein